jgi:hypothetical protein
LIHTPPVGGLQRAAPRPRRPPRGRRRRSSATSRRPNKADESGSQIMLLVRRLQQLTQLQRRLSVFGIVLTSKLNVSEGHVSPRQSEEVAARAASGCAPGDADSRLAILAIESERGARILSTFRRNCSCREVGALERTNAFVCSRAPLNGAWGWSAPRSLSVAFWACGTTRSIVGTEVSCTGCLDYPCACFWSRFSR